MNVATDLFRILTSRGIIGVVDTPQMRSIKLLQVCFLLVVVLIVVRLCIILTPLCKTADALGSLVIDSESHLN